jgi:hypothetical protein
LAERLLAMNQAAGESAAGKTFGVCARLAYPLSALAGKTGFHSILSRALTLTKAEIPRLRPTKVDTDGCVNLSEIQPHLSVEEATQGEIALVANILQLLCTFLGEALVLRILTQIWPDASFNESESGRETTA